ncbi:ferritin-like protein, partial [Chryseobacterium muglaense]
MNQKDDLVTLLRVAMSLEALTIPPYLTAYWSIKDSPTTNDNQEAKKIIHSVAMEEMLHMMSVGNILA